MKKWNQEKIIRVVINIMKKTIKLKESDLHKIVKRVLNESWFRRKKEIASFQDYEDFIGGVDNDLVVYDGDGEFLISRRGELGDEYVIKTYDKERFGEDQVVGIAKGMSKDYKFLRYSILEFRTSFPINLSQKPSFLWYIIIPLPSGDSPANISIYL